MDHTHQHTHSGQADGSWSDRNRAHFNERAATYDKEEQFQKVARDIEAHVVNRLEWIGIKPVDDSEDEDASNPTSKDKQTLRVLDYACGTGMMSRALAPFASAIVGVDISENMVEEYNTRATNQGLEPKFMHAIVGDLLSETPTQSLDDKELFDFDLATVCLGFHHFENPEQAARRLLERVKIGTGVLMIIDFLSHAPLPTEHKAAHTVMHHGFDQAKIEKVFADAGCKDIRFDVLGTGVSIDMHGHTMKREAFIARGTREQ